MKNIFVLIVSILFTLVGCSQQRNSMFLNTVLNDYSRNSYFISIKITVSNHTSLYLIKNSDLYFYFHETKNLTQNNYREQMLMFFDKNIPLMVTDNNVKKYGFINVLSNKFIDENAQKGKEYFLQKYFRNKVLTDRISETDKYYIIEILYNWSIASKIDDETGYLVIDK